MNDTRVIPPLDENFQFEGSTYTNTSTNAPANVQYADQVPQVAVPNQMYNESGTEATAASGSGRMPSAQDLMAPNSDLLGDLSLLELVQMFVVYAFIAAAALSAVFIFVGGVSFILSGGNDEKIKQAINTIRYSIIGLIVTILSFTFVAIVGRIFGLNFMGFLSYDRIRTDINRLVEPFSADNQSNFEVRN